ncbi:MAG: response regulator [Cyclobacteriaceae bacterium]|nr:response regulator [Cyclobacteriaceae bacterium]
MDNEPFLILLADDDESDRLLFIEAFSEIKIKTVVETVNDGVQLMERLNGSENPIPYFLFLDLNMPRKNGLECLKEIRSNAKLKDIFIAIFSTSENEKDMEETFLQGANVYIIKPNDFNALQQLLYKAVASTLIYEGNTFNRDNFLLRI